MVPTEQVSRSSALWLGLLVRQEAPPRAQQLRRAGVVRARQELQAQQALQQEPMPPQVVAQVALKEPRESERKPERERQLQPLEGQGAMPMALPSWPPLRALEASTLRQGFFFSAPRESKSA